jgi:HSP20 family protein
VRGKGSRAIRLGLAKQEVMALALVRVSPWQDLFEAQREMDSLMRRLFDQPLDSLPSFRESGVTTSWVPAVDVFTRGDDLVVRAELPGIDPEKDLEITVQDNVLVIRGERRHEERTEGDGIYRVESRYGAFERRIRLPEGVKDSDISATHKDGILEVVVPKAAQLDEAKRIPVQANGGRKALAARGSKKS